MSVLLQAVTLLQGREDIPSDTCGTWNIIQQRWSMS